MKKFFIFLLFLFFTTSCSEQEDLSSNLLEQNSTNLIKEVTETNGVLIPIVSSNVRAAGYDAESRTMKVQFNNGMLYEYYGVDLELWNSFVEAQPNPWSKVGYPRLVGERYSYRRVK